VSEVKETPLILVIPIRRRYVSGSEQRAEKTIKMVAVYSLCLLNPNLKVGENERLSFHTLSVANGSQHSIELCHSAKEINHEVVLSSREA
jgi:hypothetical protein